MSDYPMLISNKLHSFRNFLAANIPFFAETDNDLSEILLIMIK